MEHGVWSMEYELGACTGIAIPAANANANATATTTESFWVSDLRSVISVRSTTN